VRASKHRPERRASRHAPSDALREASYPPPYPDGWYPVATSKELRAGALRYVEALGKALIVYRAENGESVHAMSAFCPHMGANLAGGRVQGGRVECPFHRWQICPDGQIGHVPYSAKPPPGAQQETFPIRELYGQVFVYHRSSGPPARFDDAPPYEIPRVPEMEDGRFVQRGSHDAGRVRMHLLEFAENSVDFAHFAPMHGRMTLPWTSIKIPGIRIEHEAEWQLDPDRPYFASFLDRAVLHILGRKVERTKANAEITFIGPGGVVMFRFDIPDVGQIVMFQTHLPIGPLEQQVNFHWMAERKIPRLLVSYVVGNWVSQWTEDIDIWENKVYLQRPSLATGDGPIHRMRRWYSQFYPEDYRDGHRDTHRGPGIDPQLDPQTAPEATDATRPASQQGWREVGGGAPQRARLDPSASSGN
jgi:cholesterol 7-dehydrogenase